MSVFQITRFGPEDRDSFGQYEIPPNNIHIFSFAVPMFGSVTLQTSHILPNSQDFSIDLWISSEPLDGLVLRSGLGHYALIRRQREIIIYDELLKSNDEDSRFFLPSETTFFINMKNLQNRKNAYELVIEETPPKT